MKKEVRYDSYRVRLRSCEYERPNGGYEYRYTAFGKRHSIYDKTLEGLRAKEESLYEQKLSEKQQYDRQRMTLNDLYGLWKDLKRGIRDNTFRNYCYMYEQYVKDTVGNEYVAFIKKSDIKRLFNHLADERRLRTSTLDAIQNILHQVFQIAVDDEWIEHNPAERALSELKRAHNLQKESHQALTREQQDLLLRFLSESDVHRGWYPITVVFLGTGMRVGEVTGLRWCDVDFERNMISVNHTLVYYSRGECHGEFSINAPKTPTSKRLIPMTEKVRKAFLEEREKQLIKGLECNVEVDGYTNFIFLNRFGGPQHYGTLNKAYKRIIRDCNDAEFLKSEDPEVLLPNFSCHNLRHTFATRLCEAEINIKIIQSVLGHSSISTTMDIYTHVTKKSLVEAKELLERI